jgi:hypothetical protein
MGSRYEVWSWKRVDGDYKYVLIYRGKYFIKAFIYMCKEKINKVGCVKFEWR